jgi:hypothetical protein
MLRWRAVANEGACLSWDAQKRVPPFHSIHPFFRRRPSHLSALTPNFDCGFQVSCLRLKFVRFLMTIRGGEGGEP